MNRREIFHRTRMPRWYDSGEISMMIDLPVSAQVIVPMIRHVAPGDFFLLLRSVLTRELNVEQDGIGGLIEAGGRPASSSMGFAEQPRLDRPTQIEAMA